MIKDARCVAVFGRRGSGKTTRTRALVEGCPAVICFDPLGQWSREFGYCPVGNLSLLHSLLREGWSSGFKIAFTPDAPDYPAALHELSTYLWHVQQPYERGRLRRKLTLVVEEMNLSVPVHALPAAQRGFLQLVLQGRHRGIEIIGVSQRPALVSADFRANVSETYVFALGYPEDARIFRRAGDATALPNHAFIRISDQGAARGENPPLQGRKRTARR